MGMYECVNGRGRTCKRTWMNVVKYHVHFLMSVTSFMPSWILSNSFSLLIIAATAVITLVKRHVRQLTLMIRIHVVAW